VSSTEVSDPRPRQGPRTACRARRAGPATPPSSTATSSKGTWPLDAISEAAEKSGRRLPGSASPACRSARRGWKTDRRRDAYDVVAFRPRRPRRARISRNKPTLTTTSICRAVRDRGFNSSGVRPNFSPISRTVSLELHQRLADDFDFFCGSASSAPCGGSPAAPSSGAGARRSSARAARPISELPQAAEFQRIGAPPLARGPPVRERPDPAVAVFIRPLDLAF